MKLIIQSPKTAVKALLRQSINEVDLSRFKNHLIELLDKIAIIDNRPIEESEEHLKNDIRDFLRDIFYKDTNAINTKDRKDLVIHLGKTTDSKVGVIIEAKRPSNIGEMVTESNPNKKALWELILYYLNERDQNIGSELKYLIATNIHEWFIIDSNYFDKYIERNKLIRNLYDTKVNDKKDNKWFYEEIEKIITQIDVDIPCVYFNLKDYENILRINNTDNDKKLVLLYKIFLPQYLLKDRINDSNSLDKRFYSELLYIIGLTETKRGNKKLIERNKPEERHMGAILENAIVQLDSLDKLNRLYNPNHYGNNTQERLFNLALELSITWINRILFLKLLEAQLITYHKGDKSYSFLNDDKIKNYEDLNSLFFQVLARKNDQRNEDVKKVFEKVPYLNSSLFEPTEIEQITLFISNLKENIIIPVFSQTVLKDEKGKKRTGNISSLEYIFKFLDAYDFSSEGAKEIQVKNKPLINASVLGLIFEKINGYKDGSYFTPGFITMYMCRETIRKAIVQKFNESKKWNCTNIEELYDKIDNRNEANDIVNSIKICDPAVGSGHFLVSALNEIITVKNDLKILHDRDGKRLKEYQVEVINDDLIVTDEEGELFEYNPKNKESQRIQETLFHEKQNIIENCLFGVDINSNSVKICRLRLWIELLKNAYYKNETELETLPNIDINIKCGNSLVSRFAIDADLKQALRKSKRTIESYKSAVAAYRNAESKENKREMERVIADIKSVFRTEISLNDPKVKKLNKLSGELFQITKQQKIFEMSTKEKNDWNKKVQQLTEETKKLEAEIEEIKANKNYENAFEWRFEFPEVLNDDGNFVGFDVVIGNPPYIRVQDLQHNLIDYYKSTFVVAHKRIDISILFIELGHKILSPKGYLSYITSNQFLKAEYGRAIREFLKGYLQVNIDYSKVSVFDGLATYVSVFLITKEKGDKINYFLIDNTDQTPENFAQFDVSNLSDEPWDFNIYQTLKTKLFSDKESLNDIANFTYGVITGLDKAFLVPSENSEELGLEKEITKKFIRPQNYKKYNIFSNTFNLIYPYKSDDTIIQEPELKANYPNCFKFLSQFKTELEDRKDSRTTIKEKGIEWYSIMRRIDISEINAAKIIFYDVGMLPNFIIDAGNHIFGGGTSHSLRLTEKGYSDKYVLGVLNSRLMQWIIYDLCPVKMGNARKYGLDYIKKLPIKKANSKIQNEVATLVDKVISMKKAALETTDLENQIDQLVYKIYDLTEEEIKIIEQN